MLPTDKMIERLMEQNPNFQDVDARRAILEGELDMMVASWCDELAEKEIWPNAFGVLVEDPSQPTCVEALGLADNTHPENSALPTKAQVRQIREMLKLEKEFLLGCCLMLSNCFGSVPRLRDEGVEMGGSETRKWLSDGAVPACLEVQFESSFNPALAASSHLGFSSLDAIRDSSSSPSYTR
ncbi:hypothetical protein BT96DRAFT_951787 [Gymnopus androsaceus JB14]|uniref:Uncharacterized protein n=1 Tax=Gymnopus androsaceus JB14 TaxID=1447944 RepID=A0A6A4GBX8_9AGAR|nr:hypothetical protein BT96DRAFT_951787 [Gymnopus androsaceus JB14]